MRSNPVQIIELALETAYITIDRIVRPLRRAAIESGTLPLKFIINRSELPELRDIKLAELQLKALAATSPEPIACSARWTESFVCQYLNGVLERSDLNRGIHFGAARRIAESVCDLVGIGEPREEFIYRCGIPGKNYSETSVRLFRSAAINFERAAAYSVSGRSSESMNSFKAGLSDIDALALSEAAWRVGQNVPAPKVLADARIPLLADF